MKAAIYCRVSTVDQTTDNQLPALQQLCAARGWADPEIITEVESGAKERPILDRLLDRARRGEVNVIAVWALDRLGRTMHEMIARIRELDRTGVRVVSISEGWLDTGGPARELLIAIFAWVAQFERTRMIERTKAGIERARKAGKRIGHPSSITAAMLEMARVDQARGEGLRGIAKRYGTSKTALARALKRGS